MLFGTAIPTSLKNICKLVSMHFLNIGRFQNMRTGLLLRKQPVYTLMLVCWQWLIELEKAMYMVQCLAERRCSFENLVECRLNCRWSLLPSLMIFGMLNVLATQSFKLEQF